LRIVAPKLYLAIGFKALIDALSCGIYSFGALDFDIEFASTLGIKFNPAS